MVDAVTARIVEDTEGTAYGDVRVAPTGEPLPRVRVVLHW